MNTFFLLTGLFFISSTGIILYIFPEIPKKILHILISLGAGTMFSVALVHILPEAMESHKTALYAFVGGFLFIYLLEELLTPHHHDHKHHDHTHEDPHEHMQHVIIVSWIAIFVHTVLDGVGIRAGFAMGEELGMSILAGVAIHQIPVSLSVASLLQESLFAKKYQILLIALFALSAPIGFLMAGIFISSVSPLLIALVTAMAGGSLLYVSNVELLPMIHAQSSKKMKFTTVILFVLGVVGMSLVAFFE